MDDHTRAAVVAALGVADVKVRATAWVANGPNWLGVLLDSADSVLALRCAYVDQFVGVAGATHTLIEGTLREAITPDACEGA